VGLNRSCNSHWLSMVRTGPNQGSSHRSEPEEFAPVRTRGVRTGPNQGSSHRSEPGEFAPVRTRGVRTGSKRKCDQFPCSNRSPIGVVFHWSTINFPWNTVSRSECMSLSIRSLSRQRCLHVSGYSLQSRRISAYLFAESALTTHLQLSRLR